ncbi:MAG: cytochrome c-type biogenesis protein [candidate division NC10 bacterium]
MIWALVWIGLVIPGVAPAASGSAKADAGPWNPDLEDRVREIASGLRCVVCQNLSVADSPSDLAKEMRNLVRELLQQGKSREEIQAYFVSRYGEFVLLSPPKRGFNLLVWGLPFVAILAGAWGVYLVARRWTERREEAEPAVDPVYAERVRRDLQEREGPVGS